VVSRLAVAAAVLAGGCSWSQFDELADEAWVDSVGAADGVTPNDFIGLAAPGVTNRHAVFVALGRSTDSVGSYTYDMDGVRASEGVEVRAGTSSLGPLAQNVPIAGDPYSNVVGLVAITNLANNGDTKLVTFRADNVTTIASQVDFNRNGDHPIDGPIQATSLAFARTDVDITAGTDDIDVVIARGPQIALIPRYDNNAQIHACYAVDASQTVLSVAAGNFDPSDDDDELLAIVNNSSGSLPQVLIFDASTVRAAHPVEENPLEGCFLSGRSPLFTMTGPVGAADFGIRVVVGDFDGDGAPDFAISAPASDRVLVFLWDPVGMTATEVALDLPTNAEMFGWALAAGDLNLDGRDELIIGAPHTNVNGTRNAGAVYVYTLAAGDSSFAPPLTLHDAQPEVEQRFGSTVAVAPWGPARNVLVTSAVDEIFTYFRVPTFYADVRQ
jgi:hypothetical protein